MSTAAFVTLIKTNGETIQFTEEEFKNDASKLIQIEREKIIRTESFRDGFIRGQLIPNGNSEYETIKYARSFGKSGQL